MMTRREAFRRAAVLPAAVGTGWVALRALGAQNNPPTLPAPPAPVPAPTGPFKLDPLPYAADALEPHIDARTMEIHHGKHHAAYVLNLNKAVSATPALAGKSLEALLRDLGSVPENVRAAVRNHGGGHANHALFWRTLKRNEGGKPSGDLAKALNTTFQSYENFQQEFTKAAMGVFGSGWAWLSVDGKQLRLETTPNQDTPLSQGRIPILGLDVWEHAYYLKYQNRRVDYVAAFFNVIHWAEVAELHRQATS